MKFLLRFMISCLIYSYSLPLLAQESDAQAAAENILRSLASQKFNYVWNNLTSDWAHKNWAPDAFLANMAMTRPALGELKDLSVVGREHISHDQTTNVDGDIYAITFRSTYSTGSFYERVVVIKDNDGKYRFSGIFGAPVPNQ